MTRLLMEVQAEGNYACIRQKIGGQFRFRDTIWPINNVFVGPFQGYKEHIQKKYFKSVKRKKLQQLDQ